MNVLLLKAERKRREVGRFEEAVIYATKKHNGTVRKVTKIPTILHSMEVAHIISTITNDIDVMIAGLLHDVVEDTNGTLDEIRNLFGDKVAWLVDSETENKYEDEDKALSWKKRKEESIRRLERLNDRDVEVLWLADKLSNIRSLAINYSEKGEAIWQSFNQKDSKMHQWYYKTIAEVLEMHLNRTGAFKEYVKHVNSIWPGTFASEKSKYKKYNEVSIEGCKLIGKGAKGAVYRYDDELVLKVYNTGNQYKDIERERNLARQAFVAGIPTAISFGIVRVGNGYGSIFEFLELDTVSSLIASNPENVKDYAAQMAHLAKIIHTTDAKEKGMELDSYLNEVYEWIDGGIAYEDNMLSQKIRTMIDELPRVNTLIHGDFHTGNVLNSRGEYILIDMDRLSICHPIVELSGLYMSYVAFGEIDKSMVENFMGFSYEISREFFENFMEEYLGTKKIQDVVNKAALLCYVRLVRRCYKKGMNLSKENAQARDYYMNRINELLGTVDSFSY